jgi:hypothetical protein
MNYPVIHINNIPVFTRHTGVTIITTATTL